MAYIFCTSATGIPLSCANLLLQNNPLPSPKGEANTKPHYIRVCLQSGYICSMQKRWTLKIVDEEKVKALQLSLNVNHVLCRLLVQRGIQTFEQAKSFFRPSLDDLHDPFLMQGMDKAIN